MAEMPDGLDRFRNAVPPTHDERVSRTEGVDSPPTAPQETTTDVSQPSPIAAAMPTGMPTGLNANDSSGFANAMLGQMAPDTFTLKDDANPEAGAPALGDEPGDAPPDGSITKKHDTQAEPADPVAVDATDPDTRDAIAGLYGDDCPLLLDQPQPADWVRWAPALWTKHKAGVQERLHLVERNRLFRKGQQWISSSGMGPWREPAKPKDAARIVDNMIAPALDQRVNLLIEQRPGFRATPTTQDQDDLKKAEAAQHALDYQWEQQQMGGASGIAAEASYWAGTDGVAFLETTWDPDRGPWHTTDEIQDGQGQTLSPAMHGPLGDLVTRVLRIEQVRVSADASATRMPWYWVIKDRIPTALAIRQYGPAVVGQRGGRGHSGDVGDDDRLASSTLMQKGGYLLPELDALLRDQPTVDRFTVYCERSHYLAQGLQFTVVGDVLAVPPMGLLFGHCPMVRWSDGSTDPAFYPEPIVDQWIDPQMRQNALWSKWVEGIRKMAGINLLARKGSVTADTFTGGVMNIVTVEGSVDVNSVVKELGNFSMSSDVKEALAANQKRFEDLSGWSDASRGSFDSGDSGRAILAQREVLERIFAPPVNAACAAMQRWGEISLSGMRWGYDLPRAIAVQGKSRADLGIALQSEDLDGVTEVWLDPETLMPMPRALKLFMLDQLADKQLITPDEYRRRVPFAFVQNLDAPDLDHFARAKRVVQAIKQSGNPNALPMRWQDNEAIHQDSLEREIILSDDQPEPIVQAALQRWQMLAQQAQMKAGGVPPGMPGHAPHAGSPSQMPPTLPPGQQPTLGSSPPIAANAMARIGGASDADAEARAFDARSAA